LFFFKFFFIIICSVVYCQTHRKTPGEGAYMRSTWRIIIKMAFIKEESEDMKIEETFKVKQEDTEEKTGWFHSQS